jgi:hypothetical protein
MPPTDARVPPIDERVPPINDRINRVLEAGHPWEIWNEPDDVLAAALGRVHLARESKLGGWIAARLGRLEPRPIWPPGIAFPLAPSRDAREGAVGFVAFHAPDAPDAGPLVSPEMRATVDAAGQWWHSEGYGGRGVGRVWVPRETDGRSIGLAALQAGLLSLIREQMPPGATVACPFAATGVLTERGELESVQGESLVPKRRAAWRTGYRSVLLPASGNDDAAGSAADEAISAIVIVPREIKSAILNTLLCLLDANRESETFITAFARVANALNFLRQTDRLIDCLLVVLVQLPEPARQVRELATDLNVSTGQYRWQDTPDWLWKHLLGDTLAGAIEPADRLGRLVRFTQLVIARNPNAGSVLSLSELSVLLARSWNAERSGDRQQEQLSAVAAFEMLRDRRRGSSSEMEESIWAYLVLASVKPSERVGLVYELIKLRNHRLLHYAITGVMKLRLMRDDELRTEISRAWGSQPLMPRSLLHERVPVQCRQEALHFVEDRLRPLILSTPRAETIEICRYPVTNIDFEMFEPSRRDQRPPASPDDDSPVVNVSWLEASNFAFWTGLRLPTVLEWLSAAAPADWQAPFPFLPDGRLTPDRASYERSLDGTNHVHSRGSESRTHSGCAEMCGNVWEWQLDWFPGKLVRQALKTSGGLVDAKLALGGGWKSEAKELALGHYVVLPVDCVNDDLGFRCVRSV